MGKSLLSLMSLSLLWLGGGNVASANTHDHSDIRQIQIAIMNSPLLGELNSMKAVAVASGQPFRVVNEEELDLQEEVPDIIFHALGHEDEIRDLVAYKEKYASVKLVNFGDPLTSREEFDAIIRPTHLTEKIPGKNVFTFEGVASYVTEEGIQQQMAAWKDSIETNHLPVVSVLIGGDTKEAHFSEHHAILLAETLNSIREKSDVSFVITNSRRTSDAATAALFSKFNMTKADRFYSWHDITPDKNPFLAILGLSTYVVVTGDSMSMIADAVKTGKPTFVFAPEGSLELRHKLFILQQAKRGRVKPLGTRLYEYTYEKLDTSQNIADFLSTHVWNHLNKTVCVDDLETMVTLE